MNFDVVIVGGGVIGCSIAYALRRLGRRALLVERGAIGGEGATRASGGIVRGYDNDPVLAELSRAGASTFARWSELRLPGPNPLRQVGFVYIAHPDRASAACAEAARLSTPEYPINPIAPDRLRAICPFVRQAHPGCALHEPLGGFGDPRQTARQLVGAFRERGGVVYENAPVRGFARDRHGDWQVRFSHGTIEAETLVLAAGAFSRALLPDLPTFVKTVPLTHFHSPAFSVDVPVVDEWSRTYLRPSGPNTFYAGAPRSFLVIDPAAPRPYGLEELNDSMDCASRLLQSGARLSVLHGVQGLDAYTADNRPVIGFVDRMPGLYLATGFSGRGYKYSIAVGATVAYELRPTAADDTLPFVDLANFRVPFNRRSVGAS